MTSVNSLLILLVVLIFGKLEAASLLDSGCQPGPTLRMINGRNAGRAPWMAYLMQYGKYICGGSLVTSQFVITAAHCARSTDNFFVRLGEYDTMTTSDGPTRDIAVMSIYYGPFGQDIAVLKLAEEVTSYSDKIRPICVILFQNQIEIDTLRTVNNFKVTGWGYTSRPVPRKAATKLQEVSVERIPPSRCNNPYNKICCENVSEYVCIGDSGGPLTASITYLGRSVTALFGVLSHSHERCRDHSKYVDLVLYTPWMANIINNTK